MFETKGKAVRVFLTYFFLFLPLLLSAVERHDADSSVTETFSLHYVCDSIDVDAAYMANEASLERIRYYLENSPRIDSIIIYSWASPEGRYAHNKYLSEKRGEAARRILLSNSPDSAKFNSGKIHLSPLAENWSGLVSLVEQKYFRPDRDVVLRILKDPRISDDVRKWRLRQLDNERSWRYMVEQYMPELRAATWVCTWAEVIDPLPEPEEPQDVLVSQGRIAQKELSASVDDLERTKRTILAMKTNMLYDAVTALNYSVEIPINESFSVLYEQHTPWWLSKDNRKCLEFLTFGGEFRWWFAPRTRQETSDRKLRDALVGHFVGINCWGGRADIQWDRKFGCYQFDLFSAGLTYGYSLPVSRFLNIEFSISAGYARIPYWHYIPTDDWSLLIRDRNNAGTLHYIGPTKAEISLVVPIRATFNKKGGAR